ncbi:hypothetical protein KM759_gp124 [Lymphocystis disease virus 4]|uniref:Bcl-2 Bcl-2 homology region 1-3 domain-containing protein n=1 Tax=Lymphocystis disease virus 4 TaxID=2704413 RepID=A0A6B9XM53_9VIRU|nr:hypothetical protein KM759_gp124 [Lymphocystis disease virus 4]QHR78517.1 hypothetical protein [Lymphocystis disease virus 4]
MYLNNINMSNEFETNTKQLVDTFFIKYFDLKESDDMILKIMKREVDNLFNKHRLVYVNMLTKIMTMNIEVEIFVKEIVENIFSDGLINWGRIISLITFGILIVDYLKMINMTDKIKTVSFIISSYLIEHQKQWLLENNAWTGLVDFFTVQDHTSHIKSPLTLFIALISIGALLYSTFNLAH